MHLHSMRDVLVTERPHHPTASGQGGADGQRKARRLSIVGKYKVLTNNAMLVNGSYGWFGPNR